MKINGLGILTEEGEFRLHRSVLESFAIYDDTILFGVFYPNLENETLKEGNKGNNIYPVDFMLTPIPFQLWPKTARLIVKINASEQAFVINEISKILRDKGISILNSFSNRSAHRYATWDAHIAFGDLNFESIGLQEFDVGSTRNFPEEKITSSDFDLKKRYFRQTKKN